MDYELRIVVEKVAVSSQEVVKRDTIASYALQCPTSIVELGLRHGEQICLLAKIQDILLTEQSGLIDHETHVCPTCGNILQLTPCGRTRALARRIPWFRRCILDTQSRAFHQYIPHEIWPHRSPHQ
jgi:hypothetical protein